MSETSAWYNIWLISSIADCAASIACFRSHRVSFEVLLEAMDAMPALYWSHSSWIPSFMPNRTRGIFLPQLHWRTFCCWHWLHIAFSVSWKSSLHSDNLPSSHWLHFVWNYQVLGRNQGLEVWWLTSTISASISIMDWMVPCDLWACTPGCS